LSLTQKSEKKCRFEVCAYLQRSQDIGSIRGVYLTAILLGVSLGLAGGTDKSIRFYLPLRR
jgi:hypothetical protein